jgi:hypothetical protein
MKYQSPFRKIAVMIVMLLMICPLGVALNPKPAHALFGIGDITFDPTNYIQNTLTAINSSITAITSQFQLLQATTLNPLAWAIAKAILQAVVNSTINWINSGFKGSPAFVTNLNSTIQTIGDAEANTFVNQLRTNGSIKSPFQNQVANTVSTNYFQSTASNGFFTQNPYTLNKVTTNDAAFLQGGSTGFAQGGFDAFLSASMNPQNNPYGATLLARDGLYNQVTNAQSNQKAEIGNGGGFLSQKNCPKVSSGSSGTALTSGLSAVVCAAGSIINPGSTIKAALDKNLGSSIDVLVQASTFGQLVNVLFGQLMNHLLSSGGLSGLTNYLAPTATSTAATGVGGTNTTTTFVGIVNGQVQSVQSYISDWNSINAAASAAKNAVQNTTCANSQATISNIIQPVIVQAATAIAQGNSTLGSLNQILNETPTNAGTAQTTAQLNQTLQASTDYTNLLASNPLLGASGGNAIQDAQSQSTDNSTAVAGGATPTLITQMNEIAQTASTCGVPPTTTPVATTTTTGP